MKRELPTNEDGVVTPDCDVCGVMIDMAIGDALIVHDLTEAVEYAGDDVDIEQVAEAIAAAVRRQDVRDETAREAAASAYEEDYGIVAHEDCLEHSGVNELFVDSEDEVDEP